MATTFLEPGGDATFNVALTSAGGLWGGIGNTPSVATDFVHGSHINSIQYGTNGIVSPGTGSAVDTGTRVSVYMYFVALPSATSTIMAIRQVTSNQYVIRIRLTSAGVLQAWSNTAQIGTDGSTLSTGVWYRISLAYTVASTTVNEIRVFLNGVSDISITNATLTYDTSSVTQFGQISANATLDLRTSDHYIDNSSSLMDMGDVWVTAKRPIANGTANNWTTQIGSGGSGYGTGHSPQVNERALSTTNGWSIVNPGSTIVEEYTIENAATGDIDITGASIVDFVGWAYLGKTGDPANIDLILAGSTFDLGVISGTSMKTAVANSTTYPAGGTDIGLNMAINGTSTGNFYECGIIIAYILGTSPLTIVGRKA